MKWVSEIGPCFLIVKMTIMNKILLVALDKSQITIVINDMMSSKLMEYRRIYLVDIMTFNKNPMWFVIWFPSSCKSQSMLCVSLLAYAHHSEQKLWSWFTRLTRPIAHNAIWEHICGNQSHPINCRSHLYEGSMPTRVKRCLVKWTSVI